MLVAPGIYDAYGALFVEQAGFEAAYMTGNGVSASLLGRPDVGLVDLTLFAAHAHRAAACVDIPLICDADTGYGNAVNVQHTVREFEAAGVAAIHLEDQVLPKRCGHLPGSRPVVELSEHVGKIEAAIAARRDPDFIIIARTDAAAGHGLDEAIRRGKAYREAGADVVFVELKSSPDISRETQARDRRDRRAVPHERRGGRQHRRAHRRGARPARVSHRDLSGPRAQRRRLRHTRGAAGAEARRQHEASARTHAHVQGIQRGAEASEVEDWEKRFLMR